MTITIKPTVYLDTTIPSYWFDERDSLKNTAVYNLSSHPSPSTSKWAQVAQRIRENPIDLGDYTDQFRRDRQEFRDHFIFQGIV